MKKNTRITYTAKYVPDQIITNDDLATKIDTSDEWIYSRTGIKQRHIVKTENTSTMCGEVAKELLKKSQYSGSDIDFIIVGTMSPDYASPSTACLVQDIIQAENAFALDVSAACSGFVFALATAEKFISSGAYRRGIVIGGETMSKIVDWNDRSTCVLFGDGAAGVLLESVEGERQFISELLCSDGSRGMSLTASCLKNKSPFSQDISQENPYLQMDGRSIFDFALKNVSKNITNVIEKSNLDKEDIEYLLAHQANTRILDGIAKKIKIPRESFLTNIENYGNTSGASIPLLLHDSIENGTLQLGSKQKIVLTGFGGGLTWGSIILSL